MWDPSPSSRSTITQYLALRKKSYRRCVMPAARRRSPACAPATQPKPGQASQCKSTDGAGRPERPAAPAVEHDGGAVVRTYSVDKDQYVKSTRTGVTETHIRRVVEGRIDGFLEAYLRAAVGVELDG